MASSCGLASHADGSPICARPLFSDLHGGKRMIDTGTDDLLAEVRDSGVAVITMNRPERRNALSNEMLDALARVLAVVEVDDAVGCVVLTGAGGAFCAGGDVKSMAGGGGVAGGGGAGAATGL